MNPTKRAAAQQAEWEVVSKRNEAKERAVNRVLAAAVDWEEFPSLQNEVILLRAVRAYCKITAKEKS